MHNEFVFHEVERIGFCFKGIFDHFLDEIFAQTREFVNVFARVLRVRDAKTELEVERFEQLFPEKVALDHPETVDRTVAHRELNRRPHSLQSMNSD